MEGLSAKMIRSRMKVRDDTNKQLRLKVSRLSRSVMKRDISIKILKKELNAALVMIYGEGADFSDADQLLIEQMYDLGVKTDKEWYND